MQARGAATEEAVGGHWGRDRISSLLLERQFVRFLLVGVLNTAFGYSVYALLLYLGVHFALASLCSTVLGVLFNFFTTGRLVFGRREHARLFRFVLVYTVLYGLNVALLKLMNLAGINYYVAGALAIPVGAISAFFMMKHLVFGDAA